MDDFLDEFVVEPAAQTIDFFSTIRDGLMLYISENLVIKVSNRHLRRAIAGREYMVPPNPYELRRYCPKSWDDVAVIIGMTDIADKPGIAKAIEEMRDKK